MNTYSFAIGDNTFDLRRISYGSRLELRRLMKEQISRIKRLARERDSILGADAEALGDLQEKISAAITLMRKSDGESRESAKREFYAANDSVRSMLGDVRQNALAENLDADADASEECGPIYLSWAIAGAVYRGKEYKRYADLAEYLDEADALALLAEIKREAGLSGAEQGNSESPSTSPGLVDGETKPTTAPSVVA